MFETNQTELAEYKKGNIQRLREITYMKPGHVFEFPNKECVLKHTLTQEDIERAFDTIACLKGRSVKRFGGV